MPPPHQSLHLHASRCCASFPLHVLLGLHHYMHHVVVPLTAAHTISWCLLWLHTLHHGAPHSHTHHITMPPVDAALHHYACLYRGFFFSTNFLFCSLITMPVTPYAVWWQQLQHQLHHNDSAYNIMHGVTTAAAMPMWPHDSTCNTTHGAMMAARTPMQCDDSTHNTMCGTTMVAATPTQHDNSTHNTKCGRTTVLATSYTTRQ